MSLLHMVSILCFGVLMGGLSDILWIVDERNKVVPILLGILGAFMADCALLGLSNWHTVFYGFYNPIMLPFIHMIGAYTAVNINTRMREK